MSNPITAIVVGAGHRAVLYASYAIANPNELKIVGVADPDPIRREALKKTHGFSDEMCFCGADELAEKGKLADAIINGTMDKQHVETAIPLLRAGYDMLLEKPFALNQDEMMQLVEVVKETGRQVMICHVLRYAPFYKKIKETILSGEIGKIINIQLNEHVSYHHLGTAFVRGKWGNEIKCGAPMLLAKSCHDMDIMLWLKSESKPSKIASFGSDYQFCEANKPSGAGKKCMECKIETDCLYSAKKHYIDHPDRWSFYVWDSLEHIEKPTIEDKVKSLSGDNQYGRCVWDCEHTVVDHQSVIVNFADGATGSLNMIGGSAGSERNLHIIGTKGEIKGVLDENKFTIKTIATKEKTGYKVEEVDFNASGDKESDMAGHGGGDLHLVADFVNVLKNKAPSVSCTKIQDSVYGHYTVFIAEKSRKNSTVEDMVNIEI